MSAAPGSFRAAQDAGFDPASGAFTGLGSDGVFDPTGLLSGAPSFSGGPAGPAFSEAGGTATQAAPFIVGGDAGGVTGLVRQLAPLVLVGVVAWLLVRR